MTSKWLENFQAQRTAPTPLQQARVTLRTLSQQGIQIPANVAGPIIEAHKAGDLEKLNPTQERQFWEALGTLNSKIKPAENAKKYYRRTFYVVLTFLLLMQLYHTSATVVLSHLQELSSTYQDSQDALLKPDTPSQSLKGRF